MFRIFLNRILARFLFLFGKCFSAHLQHFSVTISAYIQKSRVYIGPDIELLNACLYRVSRKQNVHDDPHSTLLQNC